MNEVEPLIDGGCVAGTIPTEPPLRITGEATIQRLGEPIVFGRPRADDRGALGSVAWATPATSGRSTSRSRTYDG